MRLGGGFFAGGMDGDDVGPGFGVGRHQRVPVPTSIVVVLVVLAAVAGLTLLTGFPGPGPLRRHPMGDLQHVADQINAANALPGTASDPTGGTPPAEVDLLTSRVRVSVTADVCGAGLSPGELEMVEVRGSGRSPTCGLG